MPEERVRPLDGIRVLDLSNVLSGPYCCYQLALMGAEVIKVERPAGGDLARRLGADDDRSARNMGVSFLAQNSGKKSITLDLKHCRGKGLLKRLVRSSEVLVENFRPGVMTRLELDYEVLRGENPGLIYCAISGFGQTGPLSQRPAYDQIIQGLSGLMSITGDANSAPLRVGYPVADTVGGMAAAFAIAAELNRKPRGAMIDVSMLETMISGMGWVVSNYLVAGVEATPLGNENMTSSPSAAYRTGDGLLNIAANDDAHWRRLIDCLKLGRLADDLRFSTRTARKQNRMALKKEIETVLSTAPAVEWERRLSEAGVPSGRVTTVAETLAIDQILDRKLIDRHTLVHDDAVDLAGSPFVIDGERPASTLRPPPLGADNEEIYQKLGLSGAELADLESNGVI